MKNCPSLARLHEVPPTLGIDTAADYFGLSRGFAYRMVNSGHLPVITATRAFG